MVDLHVHNVHWCVQHGHPVLALRLEETDRYFAVAMATEDASSLSSHHLGNGHPESGRPRLYALLESTIAGLGGTLLEVQLFVGPNGILQSAIRVSGPLGEFTLPAHFADGITLAHRRRVPLRMADEDIARVPLSADAASAFDAESAPDRQERAQPPPPLTTEPATDEPALTVYREFIDSLDFDGFDPAAS